jgi:hypothetical protein
MKKLSALSAVAGLVLATSTSAFAGLAATIYPDDKFHVAPGEDGPAVPDQCGQTSIAAWAEQQSDGYAGGPNDYVMRGSPAAHDGGSVATIPGQGAVKDYDNGGDGCAGTPAGDVIR